MDLVLRGIYSGLWWLAIGIFEIFAVFNNKFASWLKGRSASQSSLMNYKPRPGQNTVWLHSSSLGEYEQGKPLLEELRRAYPQINIVVTFFSASGYDIVIRDKLPDLVIYLPFDTRGRSRKFLKIIRPDLGIFVKYDVWPNVVLEAKKRNVKLILIAALIKEESFYLKDSSSFFKKAYLSFHTIYSQNVKSVELLRAHSFQSVQVAGDPRVDRVMGVVRQEYRNERLEEWIGGKRVFIFGSNHSGEDDAITKAIIDRINEEFPGEFRFLIFPHHIHKARVQELQEVLGGGCSIYTEESGKGAEQIMIVNTIGMLSLSYRYADLVYIGGGFDGAVHNLLEPAAYEVPLFSGPGMGNFMESVMFKEVGILHVFERVEEGRRFLFSQYLERRIEIEERIRSFFEKNKGGTAKIFQDIVKFLR